MKRDNSIDIAKGFGIFFVVWGHQFTNCPVFDWIYLFHMPLFFFLGGCFVKDEKFSIFLYKKVRTLLIPFLLFYIGSMFLKILIYRIRNGNFSFIEDPYFYTLSSINYPLWFIVCLFVSLIIYYFIRKIPYNIVPIAILTIIGIVLYYYKIRLPLYLTQSSLAILFIYLGEKIYKKGISNKNLIIAIIITIPFFIYAGINNVKVDMGSLVIDSNFIIFFMPAFCGIGIILLISRLLCNYKISLPIKILGEYSLFIFAMHVNTSFLKSISEKIIEIIPLLCDENHYILGIVDTLLAVLFSFAIGVILKKYIPFFWGYKQNDKIIIALKNKL